jgi:hypothetical protein
MGVVQSNQKRTHCHFPELAQNGMKLVRGTLVGLVPIVRGSQCLRTEQGLQDLADESKREGSLGDISPANSYQHAARRQLQGVVEQCGFAQPRLPQDEQGPAVALQRVVQERSDRRLRVLSLGES